MLTTTLAKQLKNVFFKSRKEPCFSRRMIALLFIACGANAATYYVDASRPDNAGAGTSWETAKKTIQAAVDVTSDGDTVIVTNGVYNTGTTVTPGYTLKNRVVITKAITVRSVNGPDATVIEGSGTNYFGTSSAVRCAYMNNGVLSGFTLRGGATDRYREPVGSNLYNLYGGGVHMYGAASGTLVTNCIIRQCKADDGGGASSGPLSNCSLIENSASSSGGGAYSCALNACTLSDNWAGRDGGGCTGHYYYTTTINNCILRNNFAQEYGGGSYGCTLNNCTLTGNSAGNTGGGCRSGTLNNCVVWGNWVSGGIANYADSTFNYSCSLPLPAGTGNIAVDPLFVDAKSGDLRLRPESPCLDLGDNAYVLHPTDLAGAPRIQNGTVDMGAYEGAEANRLYIEVHVCGAGSVFPANVQVVTNGASVAFTAQQALRPFIGFLTNGVFATSDTNFIWSGVVADGELTAVFETCLLHVDASRTDDTGDGLSWPTAKKRSRPLSTSLKTATR